MSLKINDKVRILNGKHKGEIFEIQQVAKGVSGETWLYLQRDNVVIFHTVNRVELAQERLK